MMFTIVRGTQAAGWASPEGVSPRRVPLLCEQCLLPVLAFMAAALPALAGPATQPANTTQPARTTLEVRISPLVDLHFHLRATTKDSGPLIEIERELGGGLTWGLIEAPLSACNSAAEFAELAAQLPERFTMRSGKEVPVRRLAVQLAEALAMSEPAFLADQWPQRRRCLEEAKARIAAEFLLKQADCFADVLKHLAMTDPGLLVPVYLAVESPVPGAVTHRQRGGGGVCFVSLGSAEGTHLYETILHESIHALDIATESEDTVLQLLRTRLREAGMGPADPMIRDVPHTLMFVQAGETIRRVLDPAHKHYGDVYGYYPKVPKAAAAVRPAWESYLRGELTQQEALDRIVESALAGD